ncbi:Endoplasmin [Aphelenchoides besseyi]|nr:Endoplasmin [Aphelenchoides besseyi]
MSLSIELLSSESMATEKKIEMLKAAQLESDSAYMSFRIDASRLIHKSKKSKHDIAIDLKKLLEHKFYIGEKVNKTGCDEIYKVIEIVNKLPGRDSVKLKYKIESETKIWKSVEFSALRRTKTVDEEELMEFVEKLADKSEDCWRVKRLHREHYGMGRCVACLRQFKKDFDCDVCVAACGACAFSVFVILTLLILLVLFVFMSYVAIFGTFKEDNAKVVGQTMDLMVKMNETTTETFWKNMVVNDTLNFNSDPSTVEVMVRMLHFDSNKFDKTLLSDYINRMRSEQQSIYYAFGDSRIYIESFATVKSLIEKGVEVLMLTNPLDRRVIERLATFQQKPLVNARGHVLKYGQ